MVAAGGEEAVVAVVAVAAEVAVEAAVGVVAVAIKPFLTRHSGSDFGQSIHAPIMPFAAMPHKCVQGHENASFS